MRALGDYGYFLLLYHLICICKRRINLKQNFKGNKGVKPQVLECNSTLTVQVKQKIF